MLRDSSQRTYYVNLPESWNDSSRQPFVGVEPTARVVWNINGWISGTNVSYMILNVLDMLIYLYICFHFLVNQISNTWMMVLGVVTLPFEGYFGQERFKSLRPGKSFHPWWSSTQLDWWSYTRSSAYWTSRGGLGISKLLQALGWAWHPQQDPWSTGAGRFCFFDWSTLVCLIDFLCFLLFSYGFLHLNFRVMMDKWYCIWCGTHIGMQYIWQQHFKEGELIELPRIVWQPWRHFLTWVKGRQEHHIRTLALPAPASWGPASVSDPFVSWADKHSTVPAAVHCLSLSEEQVLELDAMTQWLLFLYVYIYIYCYSLSRFLR